MHAHLQTENFSLRQQLENLLHEARCNEEKMLRFDHLERQLIGAQSAGELLSLLLDDYRREFGLEGVSLTLVDREYEITRLLEREGKSFSRLLWADSIAPLEILYKGARHPRLAAFDSQVHGALFRSCGQPIASVALLPLVAHGDLIGSLHLGSADPERYGAGVGTDFLKRLAAIVGLCLKGVLAQERLKQAGLTDGLTGVQNRRYFEHHCQVEVAQARRHHQPLACMFLDIDRFKRINDTQGHRTGDLVLRGVAQAIQAQLRCGDTIARYGGEEFVVLLPQTPGNFAMEIAERIRQSVAAQTFRSAEDKPLQVTISVGVALLPQGGEELTPGDLASQLVGAADRALYRAKHGGRNRVVVDGCLNQPTAASRLWAKGGGLWRRLTDHLRTLPFPQRS